MIKTRDIAFLKGLEVNKTSVADLYSLKSRIIKPPLLSDYYVALTTTKKWDFCQVGIPRRSSCQLTKNTDIYM